MTGQKKYSDEFKADAVARFQQAKKDGTPTIVDLAKDLGVGDALLHAWAKGKPKKKAKQKLEKRTQYSVDFKQRIVALASASDKSHTEIAKENGIDAYLVSYWVRNGVRRGARESGASLPATIERAPPKLVNGIGSGGDITDALIYLRHAEREIMQMVRDGKIARPDQAHLLTLLALGALQKGVNS